MAFAGCSPSKNAGTTIQAICECSYSALAVDKVALLHSLMPQDMYCSLDDGTVSMMEDEDAVFNYLLARPLANCSVTGGLDEAGVKPPIILAVDGLDEADGPLGALGNPVLRQLCKRFCKLPDNVKLVVSCREGSQCMQWLQQEVGSAALAQLSTWELRDDMSVRAHLSALLATLPRPDEVSGGAVFGTLPGHETK